MCKTKDIPITFVLFCNLVKDKLEAIRLSHVLTDDIKSFNIKFGVLYNKI